MEFGFARLTASPVKGTLHGQEVELHPLSLKEWSEIEQMLRRQLMDSASKACVGISAETAKITMREASKEAARISFLNSSDDGIFTSASMMLQTVFLSLRKGDPSLTLDKVSTMLGSDFHAVQEMVKAVLTISFPVEDNLKNPLPA